jgi:hypothetical protein
MGLAGGSVELPGRGPALDTRGGPYPQAEGPTPRVPRVSRVCRNIMSRLRRTPGQPLTRRRGLTSASHWLHREAIAACQGPALHRPSFDQGVLDDVEQALKARLLPGKLLGHAEIREGHMAELVIQITDQALLKVLVQGFRYRWQHDLCAVGPPLTRRKPRSGIGRDAPDGLRPGGASRVQASSPRQTTRTPNCSVSVLASRSSWLSNGSARMGASFLRCA